MGTLRTKPQAGARPSCPKSILHDRDVKRAHATDAPRVSQGCPLPRIGFACGGTAFASDKRLVARCAMVFSGGTLTARRTRCCGEPASRIVSTCYAFKREGVHTLYAKDAATRETYAVAVADCSRQARALKSARCGDPLAPPWAMTITPFNGAKLIP